jgi:hypothetical protein
MPIVLSPSATAQANALVKGPNAGSSGPATLGKLAILDEKASCPVGTVAAATDYIRFGKIPAGARLVPSLCLLSTNHTATVAGKLQLVPLDGSAVTDITGVTVNLEATETTSVPDVADSVNITKDSWIQFIPTSDLVIASTAKDVRARIVLALPY